MLKFVENSPKSIKLEIKLKHWEHKQQRAEKPFNAAGNRERHHRGTLAGGGKLSAYYLDGSLVVAERHILGYLQEDRFTPR